MLIRRLLAAGLGILFLILLLAMLFVSHVNGTIGDPGFYNRQMEKAEVYDFVYDAALPAALEEARFDARSDNPIDTADIEDEIVSTAREVAPPEWLQENFENATEAIIPYLLGETDEFNYTLELREKVLAAPGAISTGLLEGEPLQSIYSDLITFSAGKVVENLDRVPYDLNLTETEIAAALRSIISPQWIADQTESALDSLTPYLVMDSNRFTITIPVSDLVDRIAKAMVDLLAREDTYDYLVEEVIQPTVERELEPQVELPFSVFLSREEVIDGIRQSLPPSWLEDRLEEVVFAIAAYVKGESRDTDITIDLTDRKPVIFQTLMGLAEAKLKLAFQALPICSPQEFNKAKKTAAPNSLVPCRTPGMTYEQYKAELEIDLSDQIESRIMSVIPDRWVYSQEDLLESMGAENADFLDETRDNVARGWTFTETDLLSHLDASEEDRLNDIRDWLGNGYTLTQQDIEDEMSTDRVDEFNEARSWIDSIRTWQWAFWIFPIIILIAIGFLGGRGWRGRTFWSLGTLFLASLIILIATSASYSSAVKPEVDDPFNLDKYEGLELVLAEKANEVIENAARDFTFGIWNKALWLMVLSAITMLIIIGWSIYQQRRGDEDTSWDDDEPDSREDYSSEGSPTYIK